MTPLYEKSPDEENEVQTLKITYQDISENNTLKTIDVTRIAYYPVDENGKQSTKLAISKLGFRQNYTSYKYNPFSVKYGSNICSIIFKSINALLWK